MHNFADALILPLVEFLRPEDGLAAKRSRVGSQPLRAEESSRHGRRETADWTCFLPLRRCLGCGWSLTPARALARRSRCRAGSPTPLARLRRPRPTGASPRRTPAASPRPRSRAPPLVDIGRMVAGRRSGRNAGRCRPRRPWGPGRRSKGGAGGHGRSRRAHRAGLQRHIEVAAFEPLGAELAAASRMTRISACAVGSAPRVRCQRSNDHAVPDDGRPDRGLAADPPPPPRRRRGHRIGAAPHRSRSLLRPLPAVLVRGAYARWPPCPFRPLGQAAQKATRRKRAAERSAPERRKQGARPLPSAKASESPRHGASWNLLPPRRRSLDRRGPGELNGVVFAARRST